jgi:carbamoyl-phosphate synthase large subunit
MLAFLLLVDYIFGKIFVKAGEVKTDIKSVLIIGSGPIVIGQACEFDYSGTQACKVLKQKNIRVILANNNPATIMTDPEFADATYLEPLTPYFIEEIIKKERPDALLPTLGGQTALNLAVQLHELGILDKYNVKIIGSSIEAIKKAEDRELFKRAMEKIGLKVPKSSFVQSVDEGIEFALKIGFPVILRPSFTLGGTGGGIAQNIDDLKQKLEKALIESPIKKVLIEQSVIGWKEYELEVMRDKKDNFVVVCSIENFNPMGIHTGDSITVAPAQTLTDKEYQKLRDYAKLIMREIGVETGGANIQFALNPETGEILVIEMNPRVSRSSALASKATGFPIAKIATLLALGYTLDEIPNDITKKTPASFEPSIDYCVVKIPRWDFEKFKEVDDTLGIQMKSVGEVMAIGRNFKEAFQKAIRSLEIDRFGLGCDGKNEIEINRFDENLKDKIIERLKQNKWDNFFWIRHALKAGATIDEIYQATKIDKWFIYNLKEIVDEENKLKEIHDIFELAENDEEKAREIIKNAKRNGFSDKQLSFIWKRTEIEIRKLRKKLNIVPVYKMIDTCAGEFESYTPYFYSTYDFENESIPTQKEKILIIGSGPNRIGQGIEFDYTNVHAVLALKEEGYETIMVNCNPETVSTDYDTADRLYFEPITFEDVMNIIELEKPQAVILSFGGQTPLKLAKLFESQGVKILGTSPKSIDIAEDRGKFTNLLDSLGIDYPPGGYAKTIDEALEIAKKIDFPVLVRPSYVLGGKSMRIIYREEKLIEYLGEVKISDENPILIDKFLEDAFEYDVDAICDGEKVLLFGIMEHIEEAGIHSGDSSCIYPPVMASEEMLDKIVNYTEKISLALKVRGLINIQFAERDGVVYVLEANPRSSRTVPFLSKATGIPFAKIATKILVKDSKEVINEFKLYDFKFKNQSVKACKAPVFSFSKLPNVNVFLGPEMRSTGEVIGLSYSFGESFAKAQIGAGNPLPLSGNVLISVNDRDKNEKILKIAREFLNLGFKIIATDGTARFLNSNGIPAQKVYKVNEGSPDIVDLVKEGKINFIINTPLGETSRFDEFAIGRSALQYKVPFVTTLSAALSAIEAIKKLKYGKITVKSLQEYHAEIKLEMTK